MFETSEDKDPDFSFRELECPFIFLHLADTLISNRTRFGCPEDIYTNNPSESNSETTFHVTVTLPSGM
jgi:hypothetical protein